MVCLEFNLKGGSMGVITFLEANVFFQRNGNQAEFPTKNVSNEGNKVTCDTRTVRCYIVMKLHQKKMTSHNICLCALSMQPALCTNYNLRRKMSFLCTDKHAKFFSIATGKLPFPDNLSIATGVSRENGHSRV